MITVRRRTNNTYTSSVVSNRPKTGVGTPEEEEECVTYKKNILLRNENRRWGNNKRKLKEATWKRLLRRKSISALMAEIFKPSGGGKKKVRLFLLSAAFSVRRSIVKHLHSSFSLLPRPSSSRCYTFLRHFSERHSE